MDLIPDTMCARDDAYSFAAKLDVGLDSVPAPDRTNRGPTACDYGCRKADILRS